MELNDRFHKTHSFDVSPLSFTPTSPMQLSDRARELIPKARIVSFADWDQRLPDTMVRRFQAADDQFRYLTDEDFAALVELVEARTSLLASKIQLSQQLRDKASEIVTEARGQVLEQFPGITEAGGDLYPQARADACWRDFWQFLRCVSYGLAGNSTAYLSQAGLGYMALLYEELKVPLPAMVVGIKALAIASSKRCQADSPEDDIADIMTNHFAPLISALEAF